MGRVWTITVCRPLGGMGALAAGVGRAILENPQQACLARLFGAGKLRVIPRSRIQSRGGPT